MITRRDFFKVCLVGAAIFSSHETVFASVKSDRALNMYNVHTGERLNIQYCTSGKYDRDALDQINYFLRCHYTNEVKDMDVGLVDLLCDLKDSAGCRKEVRIISGYRSPAYNESLINRGRNVARNSLHLQGLAVDIAIDGIGTDKLSKIARSFAVGGVGKYPEFVHIDVGRVRYW